MIPQELSKKLQETFRSHIDNKVHHSARACMDWIYSEDLKRAIDAVGEEALRYAHEKLS